VRAILDLAGMSATTIMASGDLNEYLIGDLVGGGAPIDIFGVGTELSTSRDEPALGGVYKMVEILSGQTTPVPKMKLSRDKATYPCRKQVWRSSDGRWIFQFGRDRVLDRTREAAKGTPLLSKVMAEEFGSVVAAATLAEIRSHAR
jgi:nicotinate phosphoribosyltransferase